MQYSNSNNNSDGNDCNDIYLFTLLNVPAIFIAVIIICFNHRKKNKGEKSQQSAQLTFEQCLQNFLHFFFAAWNVVHTATAYFLFNRDNMHRRVQSATR